MNTENTARKVGRPSAEIKYPRGIFTVDSLFKLNGGNQKRGKKDLICKLTVRKHIESQLAKGFLTRISGLQTGKPGQPASQFIRTAVMNGLKNRKRGGTTPVETPVTEPVPAEVPVAKIALLTETPVSTEPVVVS